MTVTKIPSKSTASKMPANYVQMFEDLSVRHKLYLIQKYMSSEFWSMPITTIPDSRKKKAMKAAIKHGDDDETKVLYAKQAPVEEHGGPGDGGEPGHDGDGGGKLFHIFVTVPFCMI